MKERVPQTPQTIRDQLIEQNRLYVRKLAFGIMRSLPMRLDLDELIAYGELGLVEAADRYDPLRGASFSTFAHYRITGAIYDGLRKMGHLTRTRTRSQHFAASADDLLQTAYEDGAGRRAGAGGTVEDEIASAQALIDALIPAYLLSLDSDQPPEVADPHGFSIEQIEHRELIGIVREVLAELPAKDRHLLSRIYFKGQSRNELAEEMGYKKSWISRLHARAIDRLREGLEQRGALIPKPRPQS